MSADLQQFKRDELTEYVRDQREEIAVPRAEIRARDARTDALARQLALVRRTIAGSEDEFWSLKRGDEGHNIVGHLEQYEATLVGFAERLQSIEKRGES